MMNVLCVFSGARLKMSGKGVGIFKIVRRVKKLLIKTGSYGSEPSYRRTTLQQYLDLPHSPISLQNLIS